MGNIEKNEIYCFFNIKNPQLYNLVRCLYGCETWSILRKERRLTVFENGMLRKVLSEAKLRGGECKIKTFVICVLHPNFSGYRTKECELDEACVTY